MATCEKYNKKESLACSVIEQGEGAKKENYVNNYHFGGVGLCFAKVDIFSRIEKKVKKSSRRNQVFQKFDLLQTLLEFEC